MYLDLDYPKNVIEPEAKAINSMISVVDDSFAQAVKLIYNTTVTVRTIVTRRLPLVPPVSDNKTVL